MPVTAKGASDESGHPSGPSGGGGPGDPNVPPLLPDSGPGGSAIDWKELTQAAKEIETNLKNCAMIENKPALALPSPEQARERLTVEAQENGEYEQRIRNNSVRKP